MRDGYAFYRGPAAESPPHRHAAFQVAIAVQGEVVIAAFDGTRHRSTAIVVPPMTQHRMLAATDLLIYYVEPQCAFADRLRARTSNGIAAAPELRQLDENAIQATTSSMVDPRLVEAMSLTSELSMSDTAERVGLSPQRLRALAKAQLGMPLARWRVWTRLRRAAEAIRTGESLADAAAIAGFTDQAHLTRWMREMMGVTPATVVPILRRSRSSR